MDTLNHAKNFGRTAYDLGLALATVALPQQGLAGQVWVVARKRGAAAAKLRAAAMLGQLHPTAGLSDLAWLRANGLGQVAAAAVQCAALMAAAARGDKAAGAVVGGNLCKLYPAKRSAVTKAWRAAWAA